MGDQADYIIDRMIDKHISVNGLVDMGDYVAMQEVEFGNYWTTTQGVKIPYNELGKNHARNILAQILRRNGIPNPLLLKRIAQFEREVLF